MRMPAACIYLKGDWSEYCHVYGLPTWSSVQRPCMMCNVMREELLVCREVVPGVFPYRLSRDEDFSAAASRCEIWIDVTAFMHRRLVPVLKLERRTARGLALSEDIPFLNLRKGDRLEPSEGLWDTHTFFELTDDALPVRVCFWCRTEETLCLHRCPLYDCALGAGPASSLTIDS